MSVEVIVRIVRVAVAARSLRSLANSPPLQPLPQPLMIAPQHHHKIDPSLGPQVIGMPIQHQPTSILRILPHLSRRLRVLLIIRFGSPLAGQGLEMIEEGVLVYFVRLPVGVVGCGQVGVGLAEVGDVDVTERARGGRSAVLVGGG